MTLNQVRMVCACGAESSHRCSADWGLTNVADAAWHSVWLHGDWRTLTRHMSVAERNHAADAVARYSRQLALKDGNQTHTEPHGLRWWLGKVNDTSGEQTVCGFLHDQWDGPYRMRRRCTAAAGHTSGGYAYDHGPWESVR